MLTFCLNFFFLSVGMVRLNHITKHENIFYHSLEFWIVHRKKKNQTKPNQFIGKSVNIQLIFDCCSHRTPMAQCIFFMLWFWSSNIFAEFVFLSLVEPYLYSIFIISACCFCCCLFSGQSKKNEKKLSWWKSKKHVGIKYNQKWWQQQIKRFCMWCAKSQCSLLFCVAIFSWRRSQKNIHCNKHIRQLVNRHARDIHLTNQVHIVDQFSIFELVCGFRVFVFAS